MSNTASVSVVIPCYLASKTLERAVYTVINQSVKPSEIILIDDASPDDGKTRRIIQALVTKITNKNIGILVIPIFLQHNVGPGGARNAGWDIAKCNWIAFLDADDAWDLNKIKIQLSCVALKIDGKEINMIAHDSLELKSKTLPIRSLTLKRDPQLKRVSFFGMLISNRIQTRSVMLRREIPNRFPNKSGAEDYSLWLDIILSGYCVAVMNCCLAFTFKNEFSLGGYSGQLLLMEKRELSIYVQLYKRGFYGIFLLSFLLFWSLLRYLRRYLIRNLQLLIR